MSSTKKVFFYITFAFTYSHTSMCVILVIDEFNIIIKSRKIVNMKELVGKNYLKDSASEKETFIISIKDKWVFHMSK